MIVTDVIFIADGIPWILSERDPVEVFLQHNADLLTDDQKELLAEGSDPWRIAYQVVDRMRRVAEEGDNPALYETAAKGFDVLDLPGSAEAMRRRRDHYRRLS